MTKYIQIYALLLSFIFFASSCQGQNTKPLPEANAKTTSANAPNGPSTITRKIIQDKSGNIWFASWEGIIKYNGFSFTNITKEISASHFFAVLEDKKGNFWFASIGAGVYFYDGEAFQHFTTKDGLINDRVTNIYEDKNGNIWFGTEGGASCYDGNSFRNFTTADGLPNNDINSIIEDKTGKFWFGTRGFACVYDGKKFTPITNQDGREFSNVRQIIKDKRENIWLGGKEGLWRYDGAVFTNFSTDFTGYICEDKQGNIWTSSEKVPAYSWALSVYKNASSAIEPIAPTEIKTEAGMFFGITEDTEGNIWIGNLNGVYRYDGNTFYDFKE